MAAHNPNDLPTYNLKAVVQETGLKQDTLRAWERRYGLPQPNRTIGGHRLYTQQDIDLLKWLVARQNEGLSISRAVDLWHHLLAKGQNPLLAAAPPAVFTVPAGGTAAASSIETMRGDWLAACLKFDEKRAEQLLAQAAAMYSPEVVCLEFLQKGLAEIGRGWAAGTVTVQQEHFTSALAVRRLETLIAGSPGPTRSGRILVACPPQEAHTFGLLMVTFLLRRNGWDTVFLGADVPVAHLEETVQQIKPDLVILAAQQIYTAATLLQAVTVLRAARIEAGFGGQIFNTIPALRQQIPAHFLGTLEQIAPTISQILANMRPMPPDALQPMACQLALEHYRERQPWIEAAIGQAIDPAELPQTTLSAWNFGLARNIISALSLGNISFLSDDWNWMRDMLLNHNLPALSLNHYLGWYYQAAQLHLSAPGQPILDWLAQFSHQPL